MSNLIPQQRVTKDGHVVIRHMRADTGVSAVKRALPPPPQQQTVEEEKPCHVPAKFQTKPRRVAVNRSTFNVAYDLRRALDSEEHKECSFEASDEEMYAVLSVVPVGEALTLLEHGCRTASAVRQLLSDFGIDYLEDDPDDTSEEAFRRGIAADKYCEIKIRYGNRVDRELLLDTAEAFSMKSLGKHSFYLDVLRRHTNLADIKEVGPTRISQYRSPDEVREILRDIKSGKLGFSAGDVRRLLDATNGTKSSIVTAIEMAKGYGVDFTSGLTDIATSSWFLKREKERISDPDELRKVVQYFDTMFKVVRDSSSGEKQLYVSDYEDFKVAYEAGIDAKVVGSLMSRGLTAQQAVAHVAHDIPISVSEGWL